MEKWIVDSGEWIATADRPRSRPRCALLSTDHCPLSTRPAFTLIELLVVIGIIGLVVALGVPLFGVLTGSRSQEAGQNLVAAAIGQARTTAVNEGKYAGVLFYVDPATERTAMSIVIVADPASGLEDPDPYDKYKTWVGTQQYRAPTVDPTTNVPSYGDRTIGLTSDATGTFRPSVYGNGTTFTGTSPFSSLSNFFGNYKPVVKIFRAQKDDLNADPAMGYNPPQNGPYPFGSTTANSKYTRIQGSVAGPQSGPSAQSTIGPFANKSWTPDAATQLTPYSNSGEQQLLPLGVGIQIVVQPIATDATDGSVERYVRTGVIMFDPQGRLVLTKNFAISNSLTLGKYIGLPTTTAEIASLQALHPGASPDAQTIYPGVGVVIYDRNLFKNQSFSESDWVYQPRSTLNSDAIYSNYGNIFADFPSSTAPNANAKFDALVGGVSEEKEEQWLDGNTVPLLINRFSGALSEGQ